jgi:hypothetical protein
MMLNQLDISMAPWWCAAMLFIQARPESGSIMPCIIP